MLLNEEAESYQNMKKPVSSKASPVLPSRFMRHFQCQACCSFFPKNGLRLSSSDTVSMSWNGKRDYL